MAPILVPARTLQVCLAPFLVGQSSFAVFYFLRYRGL
jgi:hypothetical protein